MFLFLPVTSSSATSSVQPSAALRALAVVAVLYVLLWTVAPPMLSPSFPLDVVESLSWGREWQWGYYKHPPLAPELLHVFFLLFGRFGPFLLSQLCIAATLWLVWCTGRRLMSPDRALLGAVLTMGVVYYTFPALEFNHNIAQMPLWAALGYALLMALQQGRLYHWLLLGALAGVGLLTKYSVAILLIAQALYLLLGPDRRCLRQPGPWLALLVMALVFLPHGMWLYQSDWLPFSYASERAAAVGVHTRLGAISFLGAQILSHLPMLVIVLIAALWARRQARAVAPETGPWRLQTQNAAYLLAVALLPGLLLTTLGLVTGARVRDMWGSPMWMFSGLLVMACLSDRWFQPMRERLLRGVTVWLVLVSLLTGAYLAWGAQWRQRPARMDWPAAAMATQAETAWAQHSHCRLDVVAGDYWLAGLVATASPQGPSVLITRDPRFSPWVTTQRLKQHGALWVWQLDPGGADPQAPAPLDAVQDDPALQLFQGQWDIPWPYAPRSEPLTMGWRAYVPKGCVQAAPSPPGAAG